MNITRKLRAFSIEALLLVAVLAFALVPATFAQADGPRDLTADMTAIEVVEGYEGETVTITVDAAPTEAIPLTAVYSASQLTVMTGTIAAGETTAEVYIAGVDDGLFEGTVTDRVLIGADGQNTVEIEVTIRDNLLENGSFEDPVDADTNWELVTDGGRFDTILTLPGFATDGDNVVVFDRNDPSVRAIGVRQTVDMPEALSGSAGDEVVLTFDSGNRNRSGNIVGARVTLLSGDDVVQRGVVIVPTDQGAVPDQTVTVTAEAAYDAITVELGALRNFTGDFGFDSAALSINKSYTIAELATVNGFDTLVTALAQEGLVGNFDEPSDGPLTVFAPTDPAFEALITDLGITVEDLLALPNLTDILLYHVVDGAVDFATVASLGDGAAVPTLETSTVELSITEDGVFLIDGNATTPNAQVTVTNIIASNGIIHVIDYVLLPN